MIRFFWDLDGTLYDFVTVFNEAMPGIDIEGDWEWQDLYRVQPHAYLVGKDIPGMLEIFNLAGLHGENHVLTAIPRRWSWPGVTQHKRIWSNSFLRLPYEKILFGPYAEDKQYHVRSNHDVLIDDMQKNIDQWIDQGGTGILHKGPKETYLAVRKVIRELPNKPKICKSDLPF